MILFIVLGIILSSGRGSFLIAGFNTMPKEGQEKYDAVALSKFAGKMMFALAGSMGVLFISYVLESCILFTAGLVSCIGIVVFMIIYVNTGNRFRK